MSVTERRGSWSAVLLCAVALGGCASAPPSAPVPERLQLDVSRCVATLSGLSSHVLATDKDGTQRVHGRFADLAACVIEDGRPGPVALFALGSQPPPLQLRVQLEGRDTGTLAAELLLLDAELQVVHRHGFAEFRQRGLDRTLTAFVNTQDGDVRYLLLRPDADHVGTTDRVISGQRWATVWVTPAVMGSYADGVERIAEVPLTDAGSLRIEVAPYATTATRNWK